MHYHKYRQSGNQGNRQSGMHWSPQYTREHLCLCKSLYRYKYNRWSMIMLHYHPTASTTPSAHSQTLLLVLVSSTYEGFAQHRQRVSPRRKKVPFSSPSPPLRRVQATCRRVCSLASPASSSSCCCCCCCCCDIGDVCGQGRVVVQSAGRRRSRHSRRRPR